MAAKNPPRPPKPDAESRAFAAALSASELTQDALAALLGVDASLVSQWKTGRRPIPAESAPQVAVALGIEDAGTISAAYRKLVASAAQIHGVPESSPQYGRPELDAPSEIARLRNDVRALNYAVGALMLVMGRFRPIEAEHAADSLRKQLPKHFRDNGLMLELLAMLDESKRSQ